MSVPTSSDTGRVSDGWMPARRGVERELADRDGHAARALVAQAQDPLVVGHDDEPHVLVRPLAQQLAGSGRGRPGVIHVPARPPDDVAELLAGAADRRRVDDRQELGEVVGQQAVEERRVAVLEGREADVLLERVGLAPEVLELQLDLLLDRQDAVGEQAAQVEALALVERERHVLGQEPAAEERRSGQPDRGGTAGGDVVERIGQAAHGTRIRAAPAAHGPALRRRAM